jgi:PAS domain-containing protein
MNPEYEDGAAVGGDHFRTLVEQAAIGIEQVSLDGRVLHANRAFAMMLGYEPEEVRGRIVRDITHPEDIAASTDLHRQLSRSCLCACRYDRPPATPAPRSEPGSSPRQCLDDCGR